MDIESAYLEADMDEVIYMRIDKHIVKYIVKLFPEWNNYVDKSGCMYVKLLKALYGTLRAGLLWQQKLTKVLKSLNYIQSVEDECVWYKYTDGDYIKLLHHVDDFLIMHQTESIIDKEIKIIGGMFSGYRCNGPNNFEFLGIFISRNEDGDVILHNVYI